MRRPGTCANVSMPGRPDGLKAIMALKTNQPDSPISAVLACSRAPRRRAGTPSAPACSRSGRTRSSARRSRRAPPSRCAGETSAGRRRRATAPRLGMPSHARELGRDEEQRQHVDEPQVRVGREEGIGKGARARLADPRPARRRALTTVRMTSQRHVEIGEVHAACGRGRCASRDRSRGKGRGPTRGRSRACGRAARR